MSDASVPLFVVLLEVVSISCALPAFTTVDDGTEYPLLYSCGAYYCGSDHFS